MVVLGDATEGAGLHKVKVHKVTGNKVDAAPLRVPAVCSVLREFVARRLLTCAL